MPVWPSTCWTRAVMLASSLRVALPLETCTAGASPKKFGAVYTRPTSSAITRIAYFQTG